MLLFKTIIKWVLIVLGFGVVGYFVRQMGHSWIGFVIWGLGLFILMIFVAGDHSERPSVFLKEENDSLLCPKCHSTFKKSDFHDCDRDTFTDKLKCPLDCQSWKKAFIT